MISQEMKNLFDSVYLQLFSLLSEKKEIQMPRQLWNCQLPNTKTPHQAKFSAIIRQ